MPRPDRCLVTGVAGFIGSTLASRLLDEGREVIGVDRFADHYPRARKEANLRILQGRERFTFLEADVADAARLPLDAIRVVFHLAGQPGVRPSWGDSFGVYLRDNVLATQALLEAMKDRSVERFVLASSSSVYGDAERLPTSEETEPRPISPYGVTKLSAEHLCRLYRKAFGVPTVVLRYFTVYGPRQRPDMAFQRFISAVLADRPVEIYGDGMQTRDFTHVDDAVDGTVRAALADGVEGETFNLGGGSRVSVNEVLRVLGEQVGRRIEVIRRPAEPGDVLHTGADTTRARERLGFAPRVTLAAGIASQLRWAREASPDKS